MADNKPNLDEINEGAGFALNAFNKLNEALRGVKNTSTGIAQDLESFVTSTSAANDLAKRLQSTNEKDLRSRKEINQLESATQKTQKEIQRITTEINVFTQRRLKATREEKNEIDKILRLKSDQLDNARYLVESANELLEVNKNQVDYYQSIKKQLKEIQGINSILSLSFFGNQILKISEQTTQFQKSLLLSAEQAKNLRLEFRDIARSSGDNFLTTDKLIAANAALSQQLGFAKNFGADLNTEFVNLTKRVGLTEEAASGFAKASILTGQSMRSIDESSAGIVSSVSSQYGIQLRVQDVMNEAGASSAIMLSNFKGSVTALVHGVSQMKALGTSLNQTNTQAESLLNFQSSIENQLNASLLTGRQINLEKARELALNNDLEGVAKELSNQAMSFGEFSRMNRIQQEGFAKSLGLSRDTLADQLLKQAIQGKSQTQITALYGKEAYERSQSLNTQEKLNAAIEKMSDIFGNLMAGPLGTVASTIGSMAENSFAIGAALGGIAAVQLVGVISQFAKLASVLKQVAVAEGVVKFLSNPLAGAAVIGGAMIAGGAIASMLGGEDDTASISTAASSARTSATYGTSTASTAESIDYDRLAQSMSKVQVAANIRINDISTPLSTNQQQNMRNAV